MAMTALVLSVVAIVVAAAAAWYTKQMAGTANSEHKLHLRQDLDTVIVKRPDTKDRLIYRVSSPGGSWADQVDLGSRKKKTDAEFIFSVGTGTALPRFVVEISCISGNDT
ncbi:hypothetical protein V3G39_04930 [Dermatophilaceae bacterium Sec6.4]